ncbi:MAG: hypothetical protein H6737_06700 [Alphaproteobacteria bacterium]|nr:hypothetical protein [Alphaproteobacteria bacterium]
MRVEVTEVEERDGAVRVGFTCDAGAAHAGWAGDRPEAGAVHVVELGTAQVGEPEKTVRRAAVDAPSIEDRDGAVVLTMQLGRRFDASTALFTMGSGHLMLEITGPAAFWVEEAWYEVTLSDLVLYDTRI